MIRPIACRDSEYVGDEHRHRGQQRAERNPERGGADVVAVHGGLAHLHVVGGHVHEVVLLEVERRRVVDVLPGDEVQLVDLERVALHALHHHRVAPAVDSEVAGHAQGVEYGDPVALDRVAPGLGHLAHHRHGQVHELHGDYRVLDEVLSDQLVLDASAYLLAGHALHVDLAEHREVDVAVGVDSVAGDSLALPVGARDAPEGLPQLPGDVGQVEQVGELRVAAVHDYGYLVIGPDADLLRLDGRQTAVALLQVLEVHHLLGRGAGPEKRRTGRKQQAAPQNVLDFHLFGIFLLSNLHEPHEVGFDLHGGREHRGYLHEQALDLGAPDGHEAAFVAVEPSSDDPDSSVAHLRGYLLRTIVACAFVAFDRVDETLHVVFAHGHRLAIGFPQEAVLESAYLQDYGVKLLPRRVDEEQVVHHRNPEVLAHALPDRGPPLHGGVAADAQLLQHPVRRTQGVGTGEVAHHKPLPVIVVHRVVLGVKGQRNQSCKSYLRIVRQAVTK